MPAEAWRALRARSRLLWFMLFASLPGMFLFSWLLGGALRQSLLWPLVTFVFVTAIGVAGLRVARFACPRCGKPFFENFYFLKLLRMECAHCGLARESGLPAPK
jgi:hypothetical protein